MKTSFVIPAPDRATVPVVANDALFPVRRIYCVGRNYAAHIREMGGDERDPPFFFQKPTDAIMPNGAEIPYPPLTKDFQFEIELVLTIGQGGFDIPHDEAARHVFGLAVGIDLTRRDVQVNARKTGRPWGIGKAFDHSAPLTAITPLNGAPLPTVGPISLAVNGNIKQQADLAEMIWNCAEVVSILSTHYRLRAGDLIFTGTPAGVGPIEPGDCLTGNVLDLPELSISIGEPS